MTCGRPKGDRSGIVGDILPEVAEIRRRKGMSVRPLVARPQMEREHAAVDDIDAFDDVRARGSACRRSRRAASSRRRPSCGCRDPSPAASATRRHSGRSSSRCAGCRPRAASLGSRFAIGASLPESTSALSEGGSSARAATAATTAKIATANAARKDRACRFMRRTSAPGSRPACARDGLRRRRSARPRSSSSTCRGRATPAGFGPRRPVPLPDRACA